jgi:hypothetical protein
MPTEKPLKQKEKPLVCFLRLYGTAKQRMVGVCEKFSSHHNEVAMAGTMKEVLRLEMQADEYSPEMAKALSEARALGLDPLAILRERIAQISA